MGNAVWDSIVEGMDAIQWSDSSQKNFSNRRIIKGGIRKFADSAMKEEGEESERDELKATWEAYDKEDSDEVKEIIGRKSDLNDELRDSTDITAARRSLRFYGKKRAESDNNKLHWFGKLMHQTFNFLQPQMALIETDATAKAKDGSSALHVVAKMATSSWLAAPHFAVCFGTSRMITLLLNRGVRTDACDKDGNNPLTYMTAAQQRDLIDEIITIAHLLCSQGSKPKTSGACLRNHAGELLAVLEYRHKCYLLLMLIPSEVIKAEKPPSPFT
ncbi:hypothetical protein L917_16127 [Phytophthora nicotianae]|uniref:Uncharacterized protein n=1 Tax=Phytophthora nicotianae TaxID=4792 RepID=W2KH75_PHYNI|nr:hypothetical protein L917_16127 [Phytophthora nicotianae]